MLSTYYVVARHFPLIAILKGKTGKANAVQGAIPQQERAMPANLPLRKPRCRGHGPLLPRETRFVASPGDRVGGLLP